MKVICETFIKIYKIILIIIFLMCGCNSAITTTVIISVDELKVETVSIPETIHLNNCGGKLAIEQIPSRSFNVSIAGFGDDPEYQNIKQKVLEKYSQYQNTGKTQKVTAPSGTDMEFNLKWMEEIRTGVIKKGNDNGVYNVRIPVSIEQISIRDLGCPSSTPIPSQDSAAIKPSSTNTLTGGVAVKSSPVGIAKLDYCTQSNLSNCIYNIRQAENKTLSIYFNLDQSGITNYFVLIDGKKYKMEPIAATNNKGYLCLGFPSDRNHKTVFMQIYTSESLPPLLEGNILIWGVPTETPQPQQPQQPPNPYKPYSTPTRIYPVLYNP